MDKILITQLRNLARKLDARSLECYGILHNFDPSERKSYYEGQFKAFKEAERLILRFILESGL